MVPTPKIDSHSSHEDDTQNNNTTTKDTSKDVLGSSHRARSHWNFVKRLHSTQRSQKSQLFKTGSKTSLTTAEATFLNMITKSQLDVDHDKIMKSSCNGGGASTSAAAAAAASTGIEDTEHETHFRHLVQAAIAKERLRDAITARLKDLSCAEAKFLTKLVSNKEVTLEALENAVDVLNNDPLYNPTLREDDDSEDGEPTEEENEDDDDDDTDNEESDSDRRSMMKRKSSAARSSRYFNKIMNENKAAKKKTATAVPARRRRTSLAERSVWEMATTTPAGVANADEVRKKRALFKCVHGESVKMMNISHNDIEEDDGLPIKGTNLGETIDPLLMAVPIEMTPEITQKTLGNEDTENPANEVSSANASFVVEDQNEDAEGISLLACCGAMTLLDDIFKETSNNADTTGGGKIVNITAPEDVEEDSLASKKRYLHLVDSERHAQLSTWIGSPEDYPILGMGKKKKQKKAKSIAAGSEEEEVEEEEAEENGSNNGMNGGPSDVDSLEPHVLSPLLMKCLRDHLPFALREENFWLKYSLARDGASLEAIFSIMRHSQHTILAIETSHGEVFGSFTSSPWRPNGNNFYGSCESFVWQLRKTREKSCNSLDEYILRESSLDVFQWNSRGGNRNVQLSNSKKLFVGGGEPDHDEEGQISGENKENSGVQWGMALALDKDLLHGTSSRCATFSSGALISKDEVFEIMNIEIWALTPCMNEESGEELELGRTFVMGNFKQT